MLENRTTMNRYGVEIQKKFALSAACIVFVLIGAPIALRFPRGGVGLVIGVSLVVFAIYYVGLIAGESLADRAFLTPFWAMWAANVILTGVGLVLLVRMGTRGRDVARRRPVGVHRWHARPASRSSAAASACRSSVDTGPPDAQRIFRPLDRYVFSEFWKIFTMTALGFPVLIVIIDLTDNLDKYLNRQLPRSQIALSYLYFIPDSMFLVMPAAVLFATVFSIGALTRHSEITAAKASGISFYRLTLPIFLGAIFAAGLALALGELVPITNARRAELLEEKKFQPGQRPLQLRVRGRARARVQDQLPERREGEARRASRSSAKARALDYPTYVLTADQGDWTARAAGGRLAKGAIHVIPSDTLADITFAFDSLHDRGMREAPTELMATPKAPQEMGYRDAESLHRGARAVGRRRERAARGARAQDRDPDHLHHHRAVRRAACHEHAARRRRVRHRHQPCDDGHLPDAHPADEGGWRQGASSRRRSRRGCRTPCSR